MRRWKLLTRLKHYKDVIDRIIDNNYQMIDHDGKRTKWGFWNPEELNYNPVLDYIFEMSHSESL